MFPTLLLSNLVVVKLETNISLKISKSIWKHFHIYDISMDDTHVQLNIIVSNFKLKLWKVQDHIRDTNEKIENLTLEFEAINEYLGDLGSLGLDHCHGKLLVVREKIQIVNELKLTVNDLQRDHKPSLVADTLDIFNTLRMVLQSLLQRYTVIYTNIQSFRKLYRTIKNRKLSKLSQKLKRL